VFPRLSASHGLSGPEHTHTDREVCMPAWQAMRRELASLRRATDEMNSRLQDEAVVRSREVGGCWPRPQQHAFGGQLRAAALVYRLADWSACRTR
jgi:hypothetical protein